MADTFTTTLSLTKPEVGASADTWGTKLNDNLDDIDALFSAGPVLKLANGGTAATTASGARTSLGLGTMATQDASAVAITGGSAALTSSVSVSSGNPVVQLVETDAGADEQNWVLDASGGDFRLVAYNDAITSGTVPISVARTGTTVDSIALTATAVTINGNAAWHAGNDGAGSGLDADTLDGQQATAFAAVSSGSFTANLTNTPGGGALASGTAYWKKVGNVVSLRLPILLATTTATGLYVDNIPADIQPSLTGTYIQTIPVFGRRNGSLDILGLQVEEGTGAWAIAGFLGTFDSSNTSKGIGSSASAAPSIVYQVAD